MMEPPTVDQAMPEQDTSPFSAPLKNKKSNWELNVSLEEPSQNALVAASPDIKRT